MEPTAWTGERLDDAFAQLREELRQMRTEMRDGFRDVREEIRGTRVELRGEIGNARSDNRSIRGEIAQMKLFMLGGLVTILAAIIATNA